METFKKIIYKKIVVSISREKYGERNKELRKWDFQQNILNCGRCNIMIKKEKVCWQKIFFGNGHRTIDGKINLTMTG